MLRKDTPSGPSSSTSPSSLPTSISTPPATTSKTNIGAAPSKSDSKSSVRNEPKAVEQTQSQAKAGVNGSGTATITTTASPSTASVTIAPKAVAFEASAVSYATLIKRAQKIVNFRLFEDAPAGKLLDRLRSVPDIKESGFPKHCKLIDDETSAPEKIAALIDAVIKFHVAEVTTKQQWLICVALIYKGVSEPNILHILQKDVLKKERLLESIQHIHKSLGYDEGRDEFIEAVYAKNSLFQQIFTAHVAEEADNWWFDKPHTNLQKQFLSYNPNKQKVADAQTQAVIMSRFKPMG